MNHHVSILSVAPGFILSPPGLYFLSWDGFRWNFAIDNFNVDLDVKFSTYGVPMIIGEIRRYLRDNSSVRVSRSMRDTAYKVLQAKEAFMAEHQREPTMEEIAKMLELRRHSSADLLQRALFQPGDLGLRDPHLGGNLHLGLSLRGGSRLHEKNSGHCGL